jgi:heme/copper-type cytochrome/quinol oxidase subunit 1
MEAFAILIIQTSVVWVHHVNHTGEGARWHVSFAASIVDPTYELCEGK